MMSEKASFPKHVSKWASSMPRRTVIAATIACMSVAASGNAQEYPDRPVRIIVGYGAGSPPDIAARVVASQMTAPLGQSVIVENKPGAIGALAMNEVLRQPADGYEVLNMVLPVLISSSLTRNTQIDPLRDFTAVGQYTWSNSILVTAMNSPFTSAKELVDAVRAQPTGFNFASGGYGTPAHLYGELFNQLYKINAVHVPYNDFSQALVDVMSGRVKYMFLTSTVAVPNILDGKMRAIAVAAEHRMASLPNVPTFAEQGIGDFDARTWDGLVVRAGTPPKFIERLYRALNTALATPEVKGRFAAMGLDAANGTSEQFGALLKRDSERFGSLINARDLKVQ